MAYNMARDFARSPRGWLLLEGTYGCGKTHLAAAVGNARLAHGDVVIFVTVPDLLDHLRGTYGPTSETSYDETFDRIRNASLLILDDLGVENPSAWAQEKLFQLLNHRYSHELPTIITTNADIDRIDPRIRSRILHAELTRRIKITAPDFRSAVENSRLQLISNLNLYDDMTFDTFTIDRTLIPAERENLEKGLALAQDYARQPEGWLLLMGEYGTGKTHLAAAIANYQSGLGNPPLFVMVPDFLDHLRAAFNPNSPTSYDRRFEEIRTAPLLVLDDLGTQSMTAWVREKLYQLFNYRYNAELPTVITTADALEDIDPRIRSRMLDSRLCTIYALTAPAYTGKGKK
jgi:DNA replication protein DnaC